MALLVRPETINDYAAVEAIHRAAFAGPKEAAVVTEVRAEGAAVLSLVGETDGVVAAHILFCRLRLAASDRPDRFAVALAPLAVAPPHQGRGLGGALIAEGLARLRRSGESLVFVYGDPGLYGRFGFTAAAAAGFRAFRSGPQFQALALTAAAPHPPADIHYPAAFRHVM